MIQKIRYHTEVELFWSQEMPKRWSPKWSLSRKRVKTTIRVLKRNAKILASKRNLYSNQLSAVVSRNINLMTASRKRIMKVLEKLTLSILRGMLSFVRRLVITNRRRAGVRKTLAITNRRKVGTLNRRMVQVRTKTHRTKRVKVAPDWPGNCCACSKIRAKRLTKLK